MFRQLLMPLMALGVAAPLERVIRCQLSLARVAQCIATVPVSDFPNSLPPVKALSHIVGYRQLELEGLVFQNGGC